jgi:sortase A
MLVVLAGLGLVGYALLSEDSALLRALSGAANESEEKLADSADKDTTMKLTVPKMARVQDLNVYSTPWDDETALEAGAQHVEGTGFPWEEEANVYIAGHRMGFPGTDSFLVFYDLDQLKEGDEVFLTDSDGTQYTYEVFNSFVAEPTDWSVTEPISGKNIVTLQTCTLPDYVDRVIVQAELTEVTPGAEAPREEKEPAPKPQKQEAPQQQELLPQQELVPQQELPPQQELIPQEEPVLPQEPIGSPIPPQEAVPPQQVAPPQGGTVPQQAA